ncbi:MAG: hypothetical protein OCD02_23515 [Spirochaetaceae bacterium]
MLTDNYYKPGKYQFDDSKENFDLNLPLNVLQRCNFDFFKPKNVKIGVLNNLLYSGKYNSVLGFDGIKNILVYFKSLLKSYQSDQYVQGSDNLTKVYQALLSSGIYIVDEYLNNEIKNKFDDSRWLTAYRYVSKNFPNIDYTSFRTIVERFKETRGYSFYIYEDDTENLKTVLKNKILFDEVVDIKAELLQLNMSELRSLCTKYSVKAARTLLETAERLANEIGEDIRKDLPDRVSSRGNLVIKDSELATGNDIISLDKYLRELAKIIRNEFYSIIDFRSKNMFFDEVYKDRSERRLQGRIQYEGKMKQWAKENGFEILNF